MLARNGLLWRDHLVAQTRHDCFEAYLRSATPMQVSEHNQDGAILTSVTVSVDESRCLARERRRRHRTEDRRFS